MRKLTGTFAAISLTCLLSVVTCADSKGLKEHVTFAHDVMVGNTMVKEGGYLIRYDAETSEMKVMKDGKVVAQTRASIKVNDKKAEHDEVYTIEIAGENKLTGLKLGGQREEIVIADNVAVVDVFSIEQIWSDEY